MTISSSFCGPNLTTSYSNSTCYTCFNVGSHSTLQKEAHRQDKAELNEQYHYKKDLRIPAATQIERQCPYQ